MIQKKISLRVFLIFGFINNRFSHSINWFVSLVLAKFKVDIFKHFTPAGRLIQFSCFFNYLLLVLDIGLFSLLELFLFILQKLKKLCSTCSFSRLFLLIFFVLRFEKYVRLFIWELPEYVPIILGSFESLHHRLRCYSMIRNLCLCLNYRHFVNPKYE